MNTSRLFAPVLSLLILVGCASGPTQAQLDSATQELATWKDRAVKDETDLARAQADATKAQQDLSKTQGDLKDKAAKDQADLARAQADTTKAQQDLTRVQADWKAYKPDPPKPGTALADPATTAILVLDLNNDKVKDPTNPASKMAPALKGLLDRARAAKVLIVYTISLSGVGTAGGSLWEGFQARPDETILTPDGFDKFYGGELQSTLSKKGIKTLIVTGSSTNFAVLYTGTSAARVFNYDVIIPTNAVVANTQYQQDYALYQFTVLPGNYNKKFSITTIDQLTFKQ